MFEAHLRWTWQTLNFNTFSDEASTRTCLALNASTLKATSWYWVRIQKPVVTYDPGKFSVTNCALECQTILK
jgi:hypothetical protein